MRTVPLHLLAPDEPFAGAPRTQADRCPTAVVLYPAADGLIARVRLPGGRLTPAQAELLAHSAAPGDTIELTARANLQLRGLRADQAGPLAAALHGAGLLPSEPHDQARTIIASPVAGRLQGTAPVDDLVAAIDDALCSRAELAALSGRFLIAVDDGAGSVDLAGADIGVRRAPAGDLGAAVAGTPAVLLVGGLVAGVVAAAPGLRAGAGAVGDGTIAAAVIAAARAFVLAAAAQSPAGAGSPAAWRVRELADGGASIVAELAASGIIEADERGAGRPLPAGTLTPLPPLGAGGQADGRAFLRALPPLGRLSGEQLSRAAHLAGAARSELRLGTDRALTFVDLPPKHTRTLAQWLPDAGFVIEAESPALGLTACAGLGCANTRGDVRAAARLRLASRRAGAPREHLVGCERRCGAPAPGAGLTVVLEPHESPEAFAARAAVLAATALETTP